MDETQANTVYHNIVKWLSPPDPSTNFDEAQEQRREGTGSWFLQGQVLKEWKEKPYARTWLHGLSGCGKTILSSSIIGLLQHEDPPPCPLIFFFFDFRNSTKQSLDGMLRSLRNFTSSCHISALMSKKVVSLMREALSSHLEIHSRFCTTRWPVMPPG